MSSEISKAIKRANPSTIQEKFMVGYQGWFTCGGDGKPVWDGHHGWLHWSDSPIPWGGHINIDTFPDMSEYSETELYDVPGLNYLDGEQAKLFSSRNPRTVERHFHWMATHGVDGAFLQRFTNQVDVIHDVNVPLRSFRDEVGDVVQAAAEKEGRVFAIMYDVTGQPTDRILATIRADWKHLIQDKRILDSPNYLKEKGKPVVAVWGLGFSDQHHPSEMGRMIAEYLRNSVPGGCYLFAGTATHWRTSVADADPDPAWKDVFLNCFDAISPWTVGRYVNEDENDRFAEEKIKGDLELIKRRNEEGRRHIDYIPVVLPGGSGFNMSRGAWSFNGIKRNGGKFLWRQIYNARRLGVRTIYGAMWDEYDEGTAFLPVIPHKHRLPVLEGSPFLALDADGFDLPPDWYMRICGYAAEILKGERRIIETFPVKELQDFWAHRPKYENESSIASSSEAGPSEHSNHYQAWLATQAGDQDAPPPPPYSLEAADQPIAPQVPVTTRPGTASAPALPTSSQSPPPLPVASRPSVSEAPVVHPESRSTLPQGDDNSRPSAPPAIASMRPPLHPHSSMSRPPPSPRPPVPGPVDVLIQDFRRQSISSPVSSPPPSLPSRPPQGSCPAPTAQHPQGQWPPAEWGSGFPQGPQPGHVSPPSLRPHPSHNGTSPQPYAHQEYGSAGHTPSPQPPNRPYGAPPQPPHQATYPVYTHGGQGGHGLPPHLAPTSPPLGSYPTAEASYPGNTPPSPQPHAASPPMGQSYNHPNHPAQHTHGTLGNAMGLALNAVDRVAGQERRQRLEREAASLYQTGNILLNKFTSKYK